MNTFYNTNQLAKPSAASTFNQTDLTKSSRKLVSKTRSFRAKLKSKIMRPRNKQPRKNSADFSSFNSSDSCGHHHNHHHHNHQQNNVVVNAFCKIMNKSLGLFKSANKHKPAKKPTEHNTTQDHDLCLGPTCASLAYCDNETQCSISTDQTNQSDHFSYEMNIDADHCCISTPKKPSRFSQQHCPPRDNFSVLDLDQNNHEEAPVHSTPDRKHVLSPIFVSLGLPAAMSSQENSYISSSSLPTSSSSASLISGNRLKSFGMTSSPVSLKNSLGTEPNSMADSQGDLSASLSNNVESFRQIFFGTPQFSVVASCRESEMDLEQQKLIRHLNNIKRNVRLSVEIRNAQRDKRELYELNDMVTLSSKKRRLQNIFRSKIHRQLKEIKTWRIGFRNKLELSNVNNNNNRYNANVSSFHFQYCDCLDCNNNQNYYMN